MKTWVSHICFYKWSVKYLDTLEKKVFRKINGTWRHHEFKGPVLLLGNTNKQRYFSTNKSLSTSYF